MIIKEWLSQASKQLEKARIGSAQLDAELILCHVLDKPREWILAHGDDELSADNQKTADDLTNQRANHTPLVHLTSKREFYGLEFEITPDVLTPRVETEKMVEIAIQRAPQSGSLLDVGTGSGAIAIAIKKNRPDLAVTATDVSSDALKVARRNAKKHSVSIEYQESDLLTGVTGTFDVITANLPYLQDDADLMPEVQKEPRVALVGGKDGLDLYRKFFAQIKNHLGNGALVSIEADPWQHEALIELAITTDLKVMQDDYFILTLQKLKNS